MGRFWLGTAAALNKRFYLIASIQQCGRYRAEINLKVSTMAQYILISVLAKARKYGTPPRYSNFTVVLCAWCCGAKLN